MQALTSLIDYHSYAKNIVRITGLLMKIILPIMLRGLRNPDGTGVMAGLTRICNVHGFLVDDGVKIPDEESSHIVG